MTSPDPAELVATRDAFVRPFYLRLLGANITLLDPKDDVGLRHSLVQAAHQISDGQIEILFAEREWRGRLTAAWLVGVGNRQSLIPRIGDLLLASEVVYAGQGYCIALALMGGERSTSLLRRYLDHYLPLNGRFYDQAWALGALAHLEGGVPPKYLQAELWHDDCHSLDPNTGIELVARVIAHLRSNNMIRAD